MKIRQDNLSTSFLLSCVRADGHTDKARPSDCLSAAAALAVLNILELLAPERRWPPMLIYKKTTDGVEDLWRLSDGKV